MIEYREVETVDGKKFKVETKGRSPDWVKSVEVVPEFRFDCDYVLVITFDDDSSKTVSATKENCEYWQWRMEWQEKKMGLK